MLTLGIAIPKTLAKGGLRGPSRLVGEYMKSTNKRRRVSYWERGTQPVLVTREMFIQILNGDV